MPRPRIRRHVCGRAAASCFKPNAIPLKALEQVALAPDEFEALRLVDFAGLQQQQAAVQMQVSRQTLALILKRARFKVVDCLHTGKALMLDTETGDTANDDRDPD